MRNLSKILWVVAVLAMGGSLFTGCAGPQSGVQAGFDRTEFRRRPLVLLRAGAVRPNIVHAYKPYQSFSRDGISDSVFRQRLETAFFGELARLPSPGFVIDSTAPFHPLDDSAVFPLGEHPVRVYFSDADLDTSRYLVLLGPIVFWIDQQRNYPSSATSTYLQAGMNWVVLDPRTRQAVAGGRLQESSTTFALIFSIITQSDWFADARKLAGGLRATIQDLR